MKIIALVLFGKNKQKRILRFNINGLSIVVGDRSTGKSSIGKIIDYCFGKDECNVPVGVIRSAVLAYGLWLEHGADSFFVARAVPDEGKKSSDSCFYQEHCIMVPDDFSNLTKIDHNGLNWFLSRKLGISENLYNPPEKSTRDPIEASAKHSLAFCISSQHEIASNASLFHGQEDYYERLVTKEVFPYFLGAVEEGNAPLIFELKGLEKEAKKLDEEIKQYEEDSKANSEESITLVHQAMEAGMIPESDVTNLSNQEIKSLLLEAKKWEQDPKQTDDVGDEKLNEKLNSISDLQDKRSAIEAQISEIDKSLDNIQGFSTEAGHQESRLASIGLFSSLDMSEDVCPFCSSPLKEENQDLKDIRSSIFALNESLKNITGYSPKITRYRVELDGQKQSITKEIRQLRGEVDAFYQNHPDLAEKRKNSILCGKIIGKIDSWLLTQLDESNVEEKKAKLSLINARIESINQKIDPEAINENLLSISYSISPSLNDWSTELGIQYRGEYRLDFFRLTLVCNQNGADIPLKNMGSSSNYLDAHLISLIGLQQYFAKKKRPVPNFLFLDQPSQPFFKGDAKEGGHDDLDSVKGIYSFLEKRVANLLNDLQIIVVDHANIDDALFQKSVVEQWYNGKGLVPAEWIEESQRDLNKNP